MGGCQSVIRNVIHYRPEFLIAVRAYYSDSCYANQIVSRIVAGFDFAASGQVDVGATRHVGRKGF
jgi:hypothetical protein